MTFNGDIKVLLPDFIDFKTTLEANGIGSEYELFHCMICGNTWESHPESCFNHKNKSKCLSVRNLVKDTPEACRLFVLAIKDGFDKAFITQDEC